MFICGTWVHFCHLEVEVEEVEVTNNSDLFDFYRPQRSWGKVMFLHVSVILFMGVGGGESGIPACIAGGIPACLAGFQANTQGGS